MPLFQGKSKRVFDKNVESEMESGKPQKQSLALSYSIQRKNKKKMANGEMVDERLDEKDHMSTMDNAKDEHMAKASRGGLLTLDEDLADKDHRPEMDEFDDEHMVKASRGGMMMDEEHDASVSDAIMRKRNKKMYADGGEVDLSINADEEPNHEDDLSYEALKKENYSETPGLDALDSPMDSNEDGHELSDADEHDMIEAIRRKMRAKRGL